MKNLFIILLVVSLFLTTVNSHATIYGNNITKNDGIGSVVGGALTEDNEAEPGMVQSQAWDLEGFFLQGKQLSIIGGYNFYTGQENMKSGDIFIDLNGDAVHAPNTIPGYNYNPGYKTLSNGLFKYDYVLDVNWIAGTFDVVKLSNTSILKDSEYGATYNTPSNPWMYVSGGLVVNSSSFNTYNKTSQSNTGMLGWNGNNKHFVATFDITPVNLDNGALFHNTMECGNDNLIGEVDAIPTPEPTTFALLGFGLLGLLFLKKRS